MERREILRYTAYATGAAISLPLMSTFLSGCKVDAPLNDNIQKLHFFSEKEIEKVKVFIDAILPKTDSPSASEVGVHHLIDSMVGQVYSATDKATYRRNFSALLKELDESNFTKLDSTAQLSTLRSLSEEGSSDAKKAFMEMRQQTIAYYLSTEEIGKNYLNYLPVPGAYEPCISLESVGGKAWVE